MSHFVKNLSLLLKSAWTNARPDRATQKKVLTKKWLGSHLVSAAAFVKCVGPDPTRTRQEWGQKMVKKEKSLSSAGPKSRDFTVVCRNKELPITVRVT